MARPFSKKASISVRSPSLPLPQHYDTLNMYKEDFEPALPVGSETYKDLDGIDRIGSMSNNALIRDPFPDKDKQKRINPDTLAPKQGHTWDGEEDEIVTPNPGIWRKLEILALSPNNVNTLRLRDDTEAETKAKRAQDREAEADDPDDDPDDDPGDISDDDSDDEDQLKKRVAMGVEEVRNLIRDTEDGGGGGGASYIFDRTKEDDRAAIPPDRIGQIKYLLDRSHGSTA
ncbi:hypothetical protein GQX73_g432 [Xylaria multiplex]|uniref:Uncharacterized protein n=1 Tax=Xylaria multiplex TaxID=323545 RepID=A0A7C8NE00_9PEZI|nr:hypothetical protein GQX73_g432 [Xylaria multiplex]